MDLKKSLETYVSTYPGNIIGVLDSMSDMLENLGKDWGEANKKEWSAVFVKSADKIREVVKELSEIKNQFDKSEAEALVEDTPLSLVKSFKNKIMKEI